MSTLSPFVFSLLVIIQLLIICTSVGGLLVSPASLNVNISDDRLFSSLRDKVILFIGDSITRYQYLNLAVTLERMRWPNAFDDDEELPGSVCVQTKYMNFNEFFYYTSSALKGHELCDCWRTRGYNYENRRYYNPTLNVSLVFSFLGRTLPQLREDFKEYPFRKICDFSAVASSTNTSVYNDSHTRISTHIHTYKRGRNMVNVTYHLKSTGDLQMCSGQVLQDAHPDAAPIDHGAVLYNLTKMFQPDVAIVNWGHHSPFNMRYKKHVMVRDSMVNAITALNREMNNYTRFVWKSTTPACRHEKHTNVTGPCIVSVAYDSTPPQLVGNLLVYTHFMEMFDAHGLVTTLYNKVKELKREHNIPLDGDPATKSLAIAQAMPVFVDEIHLHCWVNAELNRALLAQLFFQ